jgi:putative transposase
VAVLCAVLEVSRSGFYASVVRQAASRRDGDEMAVLAHVRVLPVETGQRYGRRRMAKHLEDEGMAVGRDNVRRLMKPAGVAVRRPQQRRPVTTDRQQASPVAPNLVARPVDVEKPEPVWVGEITSVWTAEGGLSVAALLDLSSRKVVGWAMRQRIDAAVVQEALRMALGRRHPSAGLSHHSARGRQ